MKHIKLYEEFVNEATTSWKKMMQGVRSSETGPWSLVAIENKKVVGQKIDIKIQDMIPAHYEAMRKEFPRAKIHVEDGTGMVVWNESLELDENFPGPGETVDAKDLNNDMLDYFNRTNKVLSIDTKSKKGIKGSVGKMYNDLVFNGDTINKRDIVRVKILESKESDALASAIDKAMIKIDDSMSYTDFALAVGKILKDQYGKHTFKGFTEVLHKDLGI